MKIVKFQVLRGPNIWSNYRKKLIQMRLDLEEMENFPTNKIDGFADRLKKFLPSMIEHKCSPQRRGGFFERLEKGTWLGHVLEHIALEIQSLAGMETGYGRTRETSTKGIYNVVYSFVFEEAGIFAGEAAFRIVNALVADEPYDLQADLFELRRIASRKSLGPSTQSIVDEAVSRGIPWTVMANKRRIQLGYGIYQKHFQATITNGTSSLAVDTAGDKELTKLVLANAKIPVAKGGICIDETELKDIIDKIGYPIVLKPLNGNQGKGASINVNDWENAVAGLEFAKQYSRYVLVERFISGYDFRMLVINNKFVAASKRIPAHVVGDGKSTILELVEQTNLDPKRGAGHDNMLTKIVIDQNSESLLTAIGYTTVTIPASGEVIYLKSTANLSTGGTAVDVTDEVHPENIFIAERISKTVGLDICGVDIVAETLSSPISKTGGVVIEVNAAPGFRMHISPNKGTPRNVASPVVDMLFPEGQPNRMPIIAITGTNGKTTTTRITAHIAKQKGYNVGYTTTDGIYIGDHLIESGDTTGPLSADFILKDPSVDFAILETARGGILRSGLSFHECDTAIITNIKEDHLGLQDIMTIKDLANVKAVVARSVKKTGWAVLNADDEHCLMIAEELRCQVAWFSLTQDNPKIISSIKSGVPVICLENDFITIIEGGQRTQIDHVANVPITFEGSAKFMVANVMASALACYLNGFLAWEIASALHSFFPGLESTPGRLNVFEFKKFKVLVDYAHNPAGYCAVEDYLKNVKAHRKIGIMSGVGDRRDQDLKEVASIAARMFDHIIIRQDHNLRGRTEEQINALLIEGIASSGRNISHEIIANEAEAIRKAIKMADEGDYVIALSDIYRSVIEVIEQERLLESVVDNSNSIQSDGQMSY